MAFGVGTTPYLTIAIVSFQRREPLRELLESIAQALHETLQTSVEVLVVLDGSSDGSKELVDSMVDGFPVALRHRWQPNGGPASARNACIENAMGDRLWFLDDDMKVSAPAVIAHTGLSIPESPGGDSFLMGPCNIDNPTNQLELGASRWYAERYKRMAETKLVNDPADCTFANTSAPTSLFRQFKFDERFRGYGFEDYEVAIRAIREGARFFFESSAAVEHLFKADHFSMLEKFRQEGANRVRLIEIHPEAFDLAFPGEAGLAVRALDRVKRARCAKSLWRIAVAATWLGERSPSDRMRRVLHRNARSFALRAGVLGVPRGAATLRESKALAQAHDKTAVGSGE